MKKGALRFTLGKRLYGSFSALILLFVGVCSVILFFNLSMIRTADEVLNDDVTGAILSLSMLEKMGALHGNVLDYLIGERDEKDDFEENVLEFLELFGQLAPMEADPDEIVVIQHIESLFTEYTNTAREQIFTPYDPDIERWAFLQARRIEHEFGNRLEALLKERTAEEVQEARNVSDIEEAVSDDIPEAIYYLSLVDLSGNLINELNGYINGAIEDKESFYANAREFDAAFEKLLVLEQDVAEAEVLQQIFSLYRRVRELSEEIFTLYDPRTRQTALREANRIEHDIFGVLETVLGELTSEEQQDVEAGTTSLTSKLQRINAFSLLAAGLMVVAGLLLSWTITRSITRIAREVKKTADRVALSSQELKLSAEETSNEAASQATSTELVSSSIEEMVASIKQNAKNALHTEQIAHEAVQSAGRSGEAVERTVNAMQKIASNITIVEEIAKETRLLSLNATIEAARAQEHGKGFSVVASEVRKLAEQSKKAAEEIVGLVNSSLGIAEDAGGLLTRLVPDIQKTAELVQEISLTSKEQRLGTEQISNAVQQLDQATQRNASRSEKMTLTAETLAAQAEQLRQSMRFFLSDKKSESRTASSHSSGRNHADAPFDGDSEVEGV